MLSSQRTRRLWLLSATSYAFAFALLSACGSHKSTSDKPEPVPECVEYERLLTTCYHRNVPFANQPILIPKTDSERDRVKALCSENIQRLMTACR